MLRKWMKKSISLFLFVLLLLLCACRPVPKGKPLVTPQADFPSRANPSSPSAKSPFEENSSFDSSSETGEKEIKVYLKEEEKIVSLPLETYLAGVVAGEMDPSWPKEALKAQAILARTFTLLFLKEKHSAYEGADISTDTKEAQAYDALRIGPGVTEAVKETQGQVLTYQGELCQAWFHAHSGGVTELAKPGLEWEGEELPYLQVIRVQEDETAPEDVQNWSVDFSSEEVLGVLKKMGYTFSSIKSVKVGEKGGSGRAVNLLFNGQSVPAASFRLVLSAQKMKSTLLTAFTFKEGRLHVEGRGYGHGVGLSQWGAKKLAMDGKSAQEILFTFFKDVQILPNYAEKET